MFNTNEEKSTENQGSQEQFSKIMLKTIKLYEKTKGEIVSPDALQETLLRTFEQSEAKTGCGFWSVIGRTIEV
jgi:hypothetical protein